MSTRYDSHMQTFKGLTDISTLKGGAERLAVLIENLVPEGHYRSLAFTQLEQAVFAATRGIACVNAADLS